MGPLLLVVYVASQLTSSYFMSTSMQRAQRILLLVLPIVFIPFILNFPAGLMVYWLTTNLWTTGQGVITRKMMPKPDQGVQRRSSRTPEGGAAGEAEGIRERVRRRDAGRGRPPRRVKKKRSGGGKRR